MDVFEDNDGLSVSIDIAQNKGLNQLAWVQDVAAPLHKLPQNNEICEYCINPFVGCLSTFYYVKIANLSLKILDSCPFFISCITPTILSAVVRKIAKPDRWKNTI